MSPLLLPLLVLPVAFHTPHDATYSVAGVPVAGGGPAELYAVWGDQTLRVSSDDGETWEVLPGNPLNAHHAVELAWHPGLPAVGGNGLLVVLTETGPWSLDPVTRAAAPLDSGVAAADFYGLDLAVPRAGSGPALMLTLSGAGYLLSPATLAWTKVFQAGAPILDRGDVALSPYYDANSTAPGGHDLFVAINGKLWRSADGGANWSLSPTFSAQVSQPTDWLIASLALSEDYAQDTTMVIGRMRMRGPQSNLDEGQIWRSGDRGDNAVLAHTLATGVFALAATPPGPGGARSFLAAGRMYPGIEDYQGTGILRSQDGGATWDDNGSFFDFQLEDGAGRASGDRRMSQESALVVLPDYGTHGSLMYTRLEGMFRSRDEGVHWLQETLLPTVRTRDLAAARAAGGGVHVLAANYGGGTTVHDITAGTTEPMRGRAPVGFVTGIAVSPQYADDGRAMVAGSIDLVQWQSAAMGATGAVPGWREPALADPVTGEDLQDYPWQLEYSPAYDGMGRPGSDQSFFWITREGVILRSDDDGATAIALDSMASGIGAPFFISFQPSPDYGPGGGTVIGGTEHGRVTRLTPNGWRYVAPVGSSDYPVERVLVPSDWDGVGNARFYALKKEAPYVFEVVDVPGSGGLVQPVGQGLPQDVPTGIAAHPDFAIHPLLFVSMAAGGIWSRDMSQPGSTWTQVGNGFPAYRCEAVDVSPDFASDGLVFAGTAYGVWSADLNNGGTWTPRTTGVLIDEKCERFVTYAPQHPANSYPDHPFRWAQIWRSQFPAQQEMLDKRILVANSDGSEARMPLRASAVEVLTYRCQGMGVLVIEARDLQSGALLAVTREELGNGPWPPQLHSVRLELPAGSGLFELVLRADLDAGEVLPVDGLAVEY